MEQNINIAALLKGCPQGTKLYSPLFNKSESFNCYLELQDTTESRIKLFPLSTGSSWRVTLANDGSYSANGECMVFPSKEVRDWGMFGVEYIRSGKDAINNFETHKWYVCFTEETMTTPGTVFFKDRISHCTRHADINTPEAKIILSTGTELKLEEEQPKFKVGDVVKFDKDKIGVIEKALGIEYINDGLNAVMANSYDLWQATPEEIERWNEEVLQPNHLHYSKSKRKIIDWFKEFDRVVVKDDDEDNMWKSRQFDYYHLFPDEKRPYHCQDDMYYSECLPYNEKTARLIGTTDDWKEE